MTPATHARTTTRTRPPASIDFGPLVLSVSVVLALGRLISHGISARVLIPMAVAAVVADVVTALGRRARLALVPALVLGAVASVLALLVIVDTHSLFHAGQLSAQFHAAQYALANDGTPLPRLNGVIIVVGALGGGAAALTRAFSIRRRTLAEAAGGRVGTMAPCLAPSFALFIYSTLVSSNQDRAAAAVAYFAGALVFIGLADRHPTRATTPSSTAPRPPTTRAMTTPRVSLSALVCCAVALAAVIGAGAGLAGMKLSVFHVTPPPAAPGPSPGSTGSGANGNTQNLITGVALVDNLLATEVRTSKVVIFHATSPAATYWEVGTLASFNGTAWLPSTGVDDALAGSSQATAASLGPAALPAPTTARTYTAQVDITDFASRLLPAPPHAVSVSGLPATPVGDLGVLAATSSVPGTRYAVTARLTAPTPENGPQLAADDPRLAPYLALPPEPAVVDQLARQAVAFATTPAEKAQALVNWFRDGQFRYTLSPPATTGADPLVQFLTVTKAGYCQQFAGAYAVLARALGLPTRLAVGFTAGQVSGGDTFTITGADAHVWPQVYLGPGAGWVSVEPTPQSNAGQSIPDGVLEPTAASAGHGTTPTGSSVSGTTQPEVGGTTGATGSSTAPGTRGNPTTTPARPGHHGIAWWIRIAALVALLGMAALLRRMLRRRRTLSLTGLDPDQRVVHAWERAGRALRRIGLSRRGAETPGEYASRMRAAEDDSVQPLEAGALAELAVLVEMACYTRQPCTPGQAAQAQRLATTIVAATRHRRRAQSPPHARPRPRS